MSFLRFNLFLLFSSGVALVFFVHFVYYLVLSRRLLDRLPGPKAPSLLWGEEWKLYSSTPGQPYARWHKRYGTIVKFRGAFGVCVLSIPTVDAMLISPSIKSSRSQTIGQYPSSLPKMLTCFRKQEAFVLGLKQPLVKVSFGSKVCDAIIHASLY